MLSRVIYFIVLVCEFLYGFLFALAHVLLVLVIVLALCAVLYPHGTLAFLHGAFQHVGHQQIRVTQEKL